MKHTCSSCGIQKHTMLNNRWLCGRCDELMLDIEIESDELFRPAPSPVSALSAAKKKPTTLRNDKRVFRR